VALRPAEAASRAGPLRAVREAAAAVRPAVLTGDGVAVLARAALGAGASGAQCAALRAASGGNPFYLSELLRAEAAVPTRTPASGASPGGPASEAVVWHVEARIRRLDPGAVSLAQALAVLGDGGRLRHAAAVAGLDMAAAIRLAAGLVRVEVLATADPPSFLHPIVRDAVQALMTSDERDAAPGWSGPGR
jgi:hypothetical protein